MPIALLAFALLFALAGQPLEKSTGRRGRQTECGSRGRSDRRRGHRDRRAGSHEARTTHPPAWRKILRDYAKTNLPPENDLTLMAHLMDNFTLLVSRRHAPVECE
jgi:hypothetical protein